MAKSTAIGVSTRMPKRFLTNSARGVRLVLICVGASPTTTRCSRSQPGRSRLLRNTQAIVDRSSIHWMNSNKPALTTASGTQPSANCAATASRWAGQLAGSAGSARRSAVDMMRSSFGWWCEQDGRQVGPESLIGCQKLPKLRAVRPAAARQARSRSDPGGAVAVRPVSSRQ